MGRVVISGLGLLTPLGNTVESSWAGIMAGKSGIGPITQFDVADYPTRVAGEVRDFDAAAIMGNKDTRKTDRFVHYGTGAAAQAIADAGLDLEAADTERIGVYIGSGIGGINTIYEEAGKLAAHGWKRMSPFFVPSSIVNMVSGYVSMHFGLKGANLSVATACTTGTHAIGLAARLIQHGDADIMLAGGAESAINPLGLGGFCAARAMTTNNDNPAAASRPFDAGRDGFVLGDGAAVVVLESYEHAKARGAKIYCEIIGFGMSGDAYHFTLPAAGGDGARRCMQAALRDADLSPADIQYINAHGTATKAGDIAETQAIKTCFGSHAGSVAVSSTKSMTGHMLGAAGAAEAIFTALALQDQVAPPTINLDNPDPECDLDYVPNQARRMNMELAMSNSFGFGGTNGTLILRRV